MSSDHRAVVERLMSAWSCGDVEGVVACCTEDCTFQFLAEEWSFEGRDGVRTFAELAFRAAPDFRWVPNRVGVDGNVVWTEWRFTLTQTGDFPGIPATGKPAEILGSSVDVIRDGLIHHHRQYFNFASFLQQLGLMPALESQL